MQPAHSHILTINRGSSSIKFALYQTGLPLERRFYGKVDRISPYDPEHLPREIELIEAFHQRYPKRPQVAGGWPTCSPSRCLAMAPSAKHGY